MAWVGSHVLPHEAAVRAWLKRWTSRGQDLDDVIQEAYCRLAEMDDVTHIGTGRAYLFQTTRNIVLEQLRRSKIVRIDNVTDMESLNIVDEAPPMDRVVAGARELQRVERLIDRLPVKCRRVFILRRIHGVSQREIARMFRNHPSCRREAGGTGVEDDCQRIGRRRKYGRFRRRHW